MFRDADSEVKDRKGELVEKVRKHRENKVDLIAEGANAINQMEYVLQIIRKSDWR
jgi:uncharacterized coiled-coil DUF342 family protein